MSKTKSANSTAAHLSWGYNTLWCLAAIGAIAYMTHLFSSLPLEIDRPLKTDERVAAVTKSPKPVLTNKKPDSGNNDKLAALQTTIGLSTHQIKQLSARFAGMEERLYSLEQQANRLNSDKTDLSTKLQKLENDLGLVTGTLAKAKTKPQKIPAAKKQTNPEPDLQLAIAALKDKKINRETKNPLIEGKQKNGQQPKSPAGSIRDIPIPILLKRPPGNTPEITKTKFAITAGHYANLVEVKLAWRNLVKHHGKLFARYKPHYNRLTINNEPRYQLVTGPIANALDAARLCYHLKQNDIPCEHTFFRANPL